MAHPAESNELPDLQDYVHEVQDECISYLNIPYNKGLFDRGPTLFFHFHFDYDPRPRNLRSRFKICFARRTSWEEYGAWVPGWGGDKREEKRTWDHKVSEDLRKKAGGQWQSRIQMIFTMTPADIGKGPSPGSTYGLSTIVGDTTPSSLDPETAGTNWEKPLKAHLNSGIDARDGITRLAIIAAKLSKNKMWSLRASLYLSTLSPADLSLCASFYYQYTLSWDTLAPIPFEPAHLAFIMPDRRLS